VLDGIEEQAKSEADQEVGTTGRGIGPTYEDKAARRGIRVADLLDDRLREAIGYVVEQKRAVVEEVYGLAVEDLDDPAALDPEALYEEYREYGRRFTAEGMVVNAGRFLTEAIEAGQNVVLEGAQGTIIDIDHGNYPYVTSSNPTAGGAATGTGLSPGVVGGGEVIGVVKAYLTRVGAGPLPTELGGVEGDTPGYEADGSDGDEEELATYIREEGGEYGTVTGRPRRVGWLDVPMLRHAARVSGFTGLAVNHLDVLAGLDEVRVGHAYELDGERLETMPATTEAWARCEPVYRSFDGWPAADWAAVAAGEADLPEAAEAYLSYLEAELDTPVYAVGVGPDRSLTVVRQSPFG
jgi:adenylosuccinate synthase